MSGPVHFGELLVGFSTNLFVCTDRMLRQRCNELEKVLAAVPPTPPLPPDALCSMDHSPNDSTVEYYRCAVQTDCRSKGKPLEPLATQRDTAATAARSECMRQWRHDAPSVCRPCAGNGRAPAVIRAPSCVRPFSHRTASDCSERPRLCGVVAHAPVDCCVQSEARRRRLRDRTALPSASPMASASPPAT